MEQIIQAQQEYIQFLENYLGGLAGYLDSHNMGASDEDVAKGKELRKNIEEANLLK